MAYLLTIGSRGRHKTLCRPKNRAKSHVFSYINIEKKNTFNNNTKLLTSKTRFCVFLTTWSRTEKRLFRLVFTRFTRKKTANPLFSSKIQCRK